MIRKMTEAEFTARRTEIQKAYDNACAAAQSATYEADYPEGWQAIQFEAKTSAKKIRDEAMTALEAEYGDTAQDDFFNEAGLN